MLAELDSRLYRLIDTLFWKLDFLSDTEENIMLEARLRLAKISLEAARDAIEAGAYMDENFYEISTIQDMLKEAEGIENGLSLHGEFVDARRCMKLAVAALEMIVGRLEAHNDNTRKFVQNTFQEDEK